MRKIRARLQALKLLTLTFLPLILLAACSSGPQINVNNEFWFGTITDSGASGLVYAGIGFEQSGSDVRASFVYGSSSSDATYCCTLEGTINGNALRVSHTDAVGDKIIISGNFSGEMAFAGTLAFVIDGSRDSFNLDMTYDSQLSSVSIQNTSQPLTIKEIAALLK